MVPAQQDRHSLKPRPGCYGRKAVVIHCNQLNLVVEIDGGIHEQQKDYDKLRTMIMNQHGITVLRFTNEEMDAKSDWVLDKIKMLATTKKI